MKNSLHHDFYCFLHEKYFLCGKHTKRVMNILSSVINYLVINYSNAFFGKNITIHAKLVKVNVNLSLYLINP
jgi:hypothetical protein